MEYEWHSVVLSISANYSIRKPNGVQPSAEIIQGICDCWYVLLVIS